MSEDARRAQRRIVRAWRALTGGPAVRDADRPTLLAVSGGADSSALALALAGRPGVRAIGHVVHDLRPAAEAQADLALVERLGERLGLPLHVERVRVPPGNAEGNARTERYAALKRLAAATRCRYVASAHHADDVLETMLANLIRGSGPRGLRGPAPRRRLGNVAVLVRPMLHATRAQSEALCAHHDWAWAHDATNDDPGDQTARLRAALRARVLPVLEELRPGAATRAARAAEAVREAVGVLEREVERAWATSVRAEDRELVIDAAGFTACAPAVREGLVRRMIDQLGGTGHDRLSSASVGSLAAWIGGGRGERTVAGLHLSHDGGAIRVSKA